MTIVYVSHKLNKASCKQTVKVKWIQERLLKNLLNNDGLDGSKVDYVWPEINVTRPQIYYKTMSQVS